MLIKMKFKRFYFLNILFFIITTATIITLNIFPLYTLAKRSPAGRTYALIHNNVQDFYFYQSLMNQGTSGNWIIYDPYTTETNKSSIIFSYFTWAGKLSQLLQIPHAYTYHAIRIIAGIFFFITAYRLIIMLKLPYPHLIYFFFLFAAPFFKGDTPYMYWWTGMDPVRRAAYLPHHMFGGFLLIVSVILILRFFSSKKIKYLLYALPLALFMSFIHTPSLIILLIVLPPTLLFYIVLNLKNWKLLIGNYWYLFVYLIIGLLSLSFMVSQTQKGFPWNQYLLWERNLQYPLDKELIGALGILFPFALTGTVISLLSKKFDRIFIACWFAVPILLIPAAGKLGMSNIRLIQGIPYLSMSILAVLGLEYLIKLIRKLFVFCSPAIALATVGLLFFAYSYREIVWSVKDQIREYSPIFGNTYLDNRLFAAFDFINKNYPPKTTSVSTFYAGNYLPVYTHTVSFIGHNGYTYNVDRKEPEVAKLFTMKMAEREAKSFLMDNKITLVFQGPEEKRFYPDYLYPNILKPVYDREEATIYEMK